MGKGPPHKRPLATKTPTPTKTLLNAISAAARVLVKISSTDRPVAVTTGSTRSS